MSQTTEVRVPDLGNFSEVSVIDVLVTMLTDPSLRIYTQTDAKVNRSGAETQGGIRPEAVR